MKNNKKSAIWMRQLIKGERLSLFFLMLIVSLSSVADILIAYVLKLFTDSATKASSYTLSNTVLIAAGVLTLVGITSVIAHVIKARIQSRIQIKIRTQLMEHIFCAKYNLMQKLHTADTLTKLTNDTSDVSAYYPRIVSDVFGGVLEAILAVVSLFLLNTKIAVIICITMPLLIVCISLFNTPISKADNEQKGHEENNRILMQEYLDQTKIIKIFGIKKRCLSILQQRFKESHMSKLHFGLWEGIAGFLNNLTGNAVVLITLGVGAYYVQKGEATIGTLMAIVQLLNYIFSPFSKVSVAVSANAQARTSAERICTILALEVEAQALSKAESVNQIRIENVWFSYDDDNIIRGASADFESGKSYCIIGENGSGKTTLINLIAGLLEPDNGHITAKSPEREPIENMSDCFVALVPANPSLFSDTIENNVTLFCDSKDIDKFDCVTEMLNITEFAASFPNGYNTIVGQRGNSLSSGQAQRIAIARALYRDSSIIIFDEPTSNLDGDSATMLKSVIAQIKRNRIVIVVSHDPSVMETCDCCYRLHNGVLTISNK